MDFHALTNWLTRVACWCVIVLSTISAGAATFSTNRVLNAPIPDNDPRGLANTIEVASILTNTTTVRVTLNLSNGWNGDLYCLLRHGSNSAVLLNRTGRRASSLVGYGDSGFNVTFDDRATNGDIHVYRLTLTGNHNTRMVAPLSGTWAPDGRTNTPATVLDSMPRVALLGNFSDNDPNGTWTVFLADVEPGDASSLVSWGLIVSDDPAEVMRCPENVTVSADAGQCYATGVHLGTPTVWIPYTILTNDAPTAFPVGDTVVTWTMVDTQSRTQTCTQVCTVRDTQPPVFVCPTNLWFNVAAGQCSLGLSLASPAVNDNCGVSTLISNAPTAFPIGVTFVTWVAIDVSGNTATCVQRVTVTDTNLACPDTIALAPVMNEFMAENHSTLVDQDGQFSDWIELFNATTNTIEIGGWYLTDDLRFLSKWRIPFGVPLAPGAFKVIFASAKDRVNPANELHTNFRIEKAGGYLALVAPNGATVIQQFAPYPPQSEDISYGWTTNQPSLARFFITPTPGATNIGGSSNVKITPEFSVGSGVFTGSVTVAITSPLSNAVIRYTLDGTLPTNSSPVYAAPLTFTNTARLRAALFFPGEPPGPGATASYLLMDTNVASFTSPLPIMVLHNFGAGPIPGANGRGPNGDGSDVVEVLRQPQALTLFDRGTNGLTSFTNPVATASRAGLRLHGSSAFFNTKKSYSLETWGETDQGGSDVSLLGMPADNDWVLYGPSWKNPSASADFDAALIHNSFIYELARASGYYAPRTRFVEVFLNTSGGPLTLSNYAGLFVLTEKVKRASSRVDFPSMSDDGTNGGWMISSDRMDALPAGSVLGSMTPRHFHTAGPDQVLQTGDDNPRGFKGIKYNVNGSATTDVSGLDPVRDDLPNYYHSSFNFVSPDGWAINTAQRNQIESFMGAFDAVLYGPGYMNPISGYPAYIDVENWVHHFILHNFPKNQDAEILSTYFVRDSATAKLKHGLIWDFDRAYNKNATSGVAGNDLEWVRNRLYYLRLFTAPDFMQAYIDKWQQLRRGAFSDSNMLSIVDRQTNDITSAVPLREGMTDWAVRIGTFKQWLTNRSAAIDAQFFKMPVFNQDGGAVSNGFLLSMINLNAAGGIFFTVDGSDPRASGGTVAATAQAWPQTMIFNNPTYVRARVLSGTNWSGVAQALFVTPQDFSGLALTEIMYNPPVVGTTDGDNFEFLELKNTGTNTLNLSGLNVTAGITFTFTNGTVLVPGQFFVLARNAAAFATKYPGVTVNGIYSGKLDNGGEQVTLSTALGTAVFSVTYDDVEPWPVAADGYGFSLVQRFPGLAQAPDNGLRWRASKNVGGSPGADDPEPNIPAVVINELLTHTDLPLVDSIELHNPTGSAAEVSGWFLSDDVNLLHKFQIPSRTIIPPGGFVVFTETNFNPTPGTNLSFSLSSLGESVYLTSADTNGTLTGYSHGVTFDASANGVSFGRYINSVGEEQWPAQITRTLGTNNSGPRIGPAVISEIFYHPPTGGVEFIEIANATGAPLPLFDPAFPTNTWRLSGASFTFPTNIIVPPNGLVVIAATNAVAFRAVYFVPTNALVFGPLVGVLQDSGERLSLRRPDTPETNGIVPYIVVDSVRYNDKAPWPPSADGAGDSLHRLRWDAYGDDPTNWVAAAPSPGGMLDSDGDGLPDWWEMANGLDPHANNAADDLDGDGLTNAQEYAADTDPRSASSTVRVDAQRSGGALRLAFVALAGRSYVIEARDSLEEGWTAVLQTNSVPSGRVEWSDPVPRQQRFYRLVIPAPAP